MLDIWTSFKGVIVLMDSGLLYVRYRPFTEDVNDLDTRSTWTWCIYSSMYKTNDNVENYESVEKYTFWNRYDENIVLRFVKYYSRLRAPSAFSKRWVFVHGYRVINHKRFVWCLTH